MSVTRLNHAVLYVRDARRVADFYRQVLGFEIVTEMGGGAAIFLRAGASDNHHDLGLFSVGDDAPGPERGRVGLYHLAWEVDGIRQLAALGEQLRQRGALVGSSDHGASKSLYAVDPDGNEIELMWAVPREGWGDAETSAPVRPLDLAAEVARWG